MMNAAVRRVNHTLGEIQKNLECSICLELLKDPVSTKCDHQFCRFCILALLDNSRHSNAPCPLCKEPVTKRSLTSNDRLNEIVRAVRSVVEAVEEDTGFKCTPPRGPRVLSQHSKPSPQSAEKNEQNKPIRTTESATNKKSKPTRFIKRGNLRQAKARGIGSIPVYIDSDDDDGSEASTQGSTLITDFDSDRVERKSTRKGSKQTANRRPLQPANQDTKIKLIRHPSKPVLPSNKLGHQNGQSEDGQNLLKVLDEGSLGILKNDTPEKQQAGELKRLPGVSLQADGDLLQAFDQESLGMHTDQLGDDTSQEKSRDEKTPHQEILELDHPELNKSSFGSQVDASNPIIINKFMKPPAIKGHLSSSADEDLEDDPYEFVPSQHTPRKPKPKRGRRQKNPSGKTAKEFDYMRWKKEGSSEKKHPLGSQPLFSQPATQTEVGKSEDESALALEKDFFKKPSERGRHTKVDIEVSQTNRMEVIKPVCPTRCEEGTVGLQRRIYCRRQRQDAVAKKAQSEETFTNNAGTIPSQAKVSENFEELHDEATTAETVTKPNTRRKQKIKNINQTKSDINDDQPEILEEPPTRRLRSRVKMQETRDELVQAHHSDRKEELKRQRKQDKESPKDTKPDDANKFRSSASAETDVNRKDKEAQEEATESYSSDISSDEDGDYSFEDVRFNEDSDGVSTPVSITDPSYEEEAIPLIFQDAEPQKRHTRCKELQLVKTTRHSSAKEAQDDKDDGQEMMESSQPVVKKHSPLATSGAFGQVYKRGSRRNQESSGEVDLDELGDKSLNEKVKRMYQDNEDLTCSWEEEHLVSGIKETVEDYSVAEQVISNHTKSDLAEESDVEYSREELIRTDLQDKVKQPHSSTNLAGKLKAEKPPHDTAAIKSDWKLALELAREFDTEPRQFSLRSSKRGGRKDLETKDESSQPSRTKPELDVSVPSKIGREKSGSRRADVKECKLTGDVGETSEPRKEDRTITAGKKTLRRTQRLERSDVRKEKDAITKCKGKKRRRHSSGLPITCHAADGLDGEPGGKIESYDSNLEHGQSELEKGKPVVPSPTVGEAHVLPDPDLQQSTFFVHTVKNLNSTMNLLNRQTKADSKNDAERKTRSKRKTRQSGGKSNKVAETTIPANKPEMMATEVEDSGSRMRKTRSTTEKFLISPNKGTDENSETNSTAKESSLTRKIASKQAIESASLFTEDFEQPRAEQHQEHAPIRSWNRTRDHSTKGTREGDSDGDTTESIDFEANDKGMNCSSPSAATHLSGSDTNSIELGEDEENVRFVQPIPSNEKPRKSQTSTSGRTSVRQKPCQSSKKGIVEEVKSPRTFSQKTVTPEETSKGNASKIGVKCEPTEKSRNTIPKTFTSQATQKSSQSTTLSETSVKKEIKGPAIEIPMISGDLQASGKNQLCQNSKRGLKASPEAAFEKSFEDSSNQKSERMLVPPPSHYQKTFMESANSTSSTICQVPTPESRPSSTRSRLSSKRKSCPEKGSSNEMNSSNKRHRSAGATHSEIQHWDMGSRRRSERLSRPASLEHSPLKSPKEFEDIPASLESIGYISGGCASVETQNYVDTNIQTRCKNRSLSRSQKSMSESKVTTSSQKQQAVPADSSHQNKKFSQEISYEGSCTELKGHQEKEGTLTILGSCPLFEEDNSRSSQSQHLTRNQDLLLRDTLVCRTERSDSFQTATAGSSSLFTPTKMSPSATEKSSDTCRNKKTVTKQENKCITNKPEKCRTDSLQMSLTHEENIKDSTKSFAENSSDHSKKHKLSSSSKSSDTSRASLSIPFQGKQEDVRLKKVTETHGRRSENATKPPSEECVPASEGASVSPENLSDPIIIARRHLHSCGEDVSSSLIETTGNTKDKSTFKNHAAGQSEEPASGSSSKKRFSFKRKSIRSQDTDVSFLGQRDSNTKVEKKGIREVGHNDSSFSNKSSSALISKDPSPRRRQVQQVSSSDGLGPRNSENSELTLTPSPNSKKRKRKSPTLTTGIKAKQTRQDKTLQDHNWSQTSRNMVRKSSQEITNGEAPGGVDQQLDSSGDVEMVSAEDDEHNKNKKDGDNDDVGEGDVCDKNEDRQDENKNDCEDITDKYQEDDDDNDDDDNDDNDDDDDDDDDDVIIPPTPPCQPTTNFQTGKRPAYLIHAASSASSNRGIHSTGSVKASSVQTGAFRSSQRLGDNRKTANAKESVFLGSGKAKIKVDAGNNKDGYHSQNDDMADNSFERRAFPLSSSPMEKNVGEDAAQNSQSLSILQGFVQGDFLKANTEKSFNKRSSARSNYRKRLQIDQDMEDDVEALGETRGRQDHSEGFPNFPDKSSSNKSKQKKQQSDNAVNVQKETARGSRHDTCETPKELAGREMSDEADDIREMRKDAAVVCQDAGVDQEDKDMHNDRQHDTEGSTCSESSSSHHLNLTSASSVLSSQSELLNTQQRLNAKESLQKMALEIAQIEAVLADDASNDKHPDTSLAKHRDTTLAKHPENKEDHTLHSHQDGNHDKVDSKSYSDQGDFDLDPISHDDPCSPSDDLCTPGDLFTPSDSCSQNVNDNVPKDACTKEVISDSNTDTPDGSRHLSKRSSHFTSKRSRPIISDDESESEEEACGGFIDATKSRRSTEMRDDVPLGSGLSGELSYISDSEKNVRKKLPTWRENLGTLSPPSVSQSTTMRSSPLASANSTLIGSSSKSQFEIPGVTTYGSDSDLSEQEDADISLGCPLSPSPPRSPSPPPEMSQSTARRASLPSNLPECLQAVSRLVEEIKLQRGSSRQSKSGQELGYSSKKRKSGGGSGKILRMQIATDSDSDDDGYRASSPKPRSRHEQRSETEQRTPRQTTSGWRSKTLEMLSDSRLKNKPRNVTPNSEAKKRTTPAMKSRQRTQAVRDSGNRSYHSNKRDNQHQDESPDERSLSPVIGRSLLTTPAARKKTKPLSFVTTGLNRTDMRDVEQLTKRFGCRFASTFNACTTHVIVNTDEDFVCERTLKYFQGIAARIWVVSFKWVTACLKTEQLLPEKPFEVQGDVVNGASHNGPEKARLCRGPYPLQRYDVCCVGPFTGLSKEQLVSLLELMGASTVQHPSLFPYSAGRKTVIIAQAEATDSEHDYDALYKKYRVPVTSREWVLDVIATYKIQPMTDYLLSLSGSSQPIIDLDSDEN